MNVCFLCVLNIVLLTHMIYINPMQELESTTSHYKDMSTSMSVKVERGKQRGGSSAIYVYIVNFACPLTQD